MTQPNKSVSRDLLQLEGAGAPISPFLISPGGGGGGAAFPFAPPPSRQLGHAPLPLPPALAGSSDAAAAAASSVGGNGAAASASAFGSGPPSRLKTFSIPPSSLLSRVQAFLPELAKANAKLEQDIAVLGPEAFDIENVTTSSVNADSTSNTAGQHIVMDLSVGVLELQKDAPELDEPAIIIPGVSDPSKLSDSGAAGNSDSDEDDEGRQGTNGGGSGGAGSKAARKKRKYRARAKLKQNAASAASTGSGSGADGSSDSPPLPAPAKGSLIQVMEE